MEKISVIVPVHNVENYIEKCLNSILSQTYKNLEIILIDDGSTDLSSEICDKYGNADERIIVIHQPNQGVSSARNRGLDIMSGDIVSFIDPDDSIAPQMYEDMLFLMLSTYSEIAVCDFNDYVEGEICKSVQWDGGFKCYEKNMSIEKILLSSVSCCNKLFQIKCIGNTRFPENIINGEDMMFLIDVLLRIRKVCFLDANFYTRLERKNSATHQKFTPNFLDNFIASQYVYECVSSYDKKLSHSGIFCVFGTLIQTMEKFAKMDRMEINLNKKYVFIHRNNIKKYYLKILSNKYIPLKSKVAIILFRIDPNLFIFMKKLYLKLKC